MSIVNKLKAIADIITPPAGYKTLFFRSDTGVPAVKDENGVVSDLVIPGDASGVTFEPADVLNWTDSVDPGNVDDALDDLALRVNTLETAEAPDATIVTFTPSDATDWNGDVDPGDVQEALDQLADRVTTNEGAIGTNNFGIVAVAGQSNVAADAIGDTLTLAGAGLAVITTDAGTDTVTITVSVPDASVVPFTPSNSMNWTDSEDPGDVDDALNDLAARLQGIEETESVFRNVAVSGQDTIIADGSNDTLTFAAGSNITITTNASTDTITIASSGGGGGDSTTTSAYASRPAASNDGNLFLPNDGYYVERDTGAAWKPWGPIWPLVAPVDSDFSWVNQGTSSVVTTNGGIALIGQLGTTLNVRARVKTAPATPYTLKALILPRLVNSTQQLAGLCFRQSSDGKMTLFGFDVNTSSSFLSINNVTNPTTFSASVGLAANLWGNHHPIWLRLTDNGTDKSMSWSADGYNWQVFYSVGRTTFLTPDQIGFYVNDTTNVWTPAVTVLSWEQT